MATQQYGPWPLDLGFGYLFGDDTDNESLVIGADGRETRFYGHNLFDGTLNPRPTLPEMAPAMEKFLEAPRP